MAESKSERRVRIEREAKERQADRDAAGRQAESDARQREADSAARRAEADARAREADARAAAEKARIEAEQDGRRLEAETARRRQEAEDDKRRIEADEKKRRDEAAPREQAIKLGLNLGAALTGIYAAGKIAAKITDAHVAGVKAANNQLREIGRTIDAATPKRGAPTINQKARLTGAVKAADDLKLANRPRALGLAVAGTLLAEGIASRLFLAPLAPEGPAREAINAVGTASLFAGGGIIGKRVQANATTANLPPVKAVAQIEMARTMIGGQAPPSTAARVIEAVKSPKAGKIAIATGALLTLGFMASRARAEQPADAAPPATPDGAVANDRLAVAQTAAARVAAEMAVASSAGSLRAGQQEMGDGMTDGYFRTQHGKRVQVGGYKTPK